MLAHKSRWLRICLHPITISNHVRKLSQQFIQGQSPKEGVREYFYYIDHQGQLFLEGTKIKNFVTCFKDKDFLIFFFKRLKINKSNRYADDFPYISRCGPELNYIRCESKPIVYTDIYLNDNKYELILNNIGAKFTVPFQPQKLCMLPKNGRVYHPASTKVGGAGILKTSLAIEFSSYFTFEDTKDIEQPTHFIWDGRKYELDNELWGYMQHENVEDEC